MKFYRSLAPLIFALAFLASCFNIGACVEFTGCEINLGATVDELTEQPNDGSLGDALRRVIDERL